MLVLSRRSGQWVELTHAASGDTVRIRVYNIIHNRADLAFDDDARHFLIERPERAVTMNEGTTNGQRTADGNS